MAYCILREFNPTPEWSWGGSVAYLRIFASEGFFEQSTGEYIAQGRVNDISSFCQTITCTVTGTQVSIPEVTLASTLDSSNPSARFTAILYDSKNVPRYTLLSQFFVDSDFFQTPAESSILVTDAGTAAANQYYVFSGTSAGFNYYNVRDEAASVTLSAIVNTGSEWRLYNAAGTNLYHSSNNPDLPFDATWVTGGSSSGSLPVPTVAENPELVTATWEQLIVSNQGIAQNFFNETWTIPQIKQYVNSIVGDGTTPFAARLVVGKTALTRDPAAGPIAVASNDYVWEGINETVYLSSYGSTLAGFDAAVAAIGSTPTDFKITNALAITANRTLPTTLNLIREGDGLITVSSGVTLTVGKMEDPGNIQFFVQQSSTANIRFSLGAVNHINIAWFVGAAGLCTNAINQAIASCTANDGGVIFFPQGDWTTAGGHVVGNKLVLAGTGKDTKITATGAGTGVFTHGANIYNVTVRDLIINGGGFNIAGYLCSAAYGDGSSGALSFENVYLQSCQYGLRIYDTLSTEWQMAAVSFDANCRITNNTYGVWCNTINNVLKCDAFFEVAASQWAAYALSTGQWTFTANEFAGSPFLGTNQIESQTIVAAAGVTGDGVAQSVVTAPGMPGSPKTVSIAVDTTMTTATLIATAFRAALGADPSVTMFFHIGGTGATVQLIALDPAANQATMNFTINTGTATGITNNATSTNTAAGVADTTQAQGFYFQNAHGVVNFLGTVEEGFRDFIVNDAADLNSVINFVGATIQSAIRLNAGCQLNTTNCTIVDRSIRGYLDDSLYNSVADIVPVTSYYGGAFRTLSARTPYNFNGDTALSGAQVGFDISQSNRRINTQFTGRFFHNDTGFFEPRDEGRMELMSSADPSGGDNWVMLRIGRCTATGEPLYFYDIYRDYPTGFLHFTGNQTGFRAYVFDDDLSAAGTITSTDATTPILATATGKTNTGYLSLPGKTSGSFQILPADAMAQLMTIAPAAQTVGAVVLTIPNFANVNDTFVFVTLAQTLLNKTLTTPVLTNPTVSTGTFTSPALVTPSLGIATGTSLAVTGLLKSSGTAGVGYATGAGGAVTQLTSRTTGVTLNKTTGAITLFSAAGSATPFSFTVTNSTVVATDTIIINQKSGTDLYTTQVVSAVGAGTFQLTLANASGTTVEQPVFNFSVVKGVAS